MFGRDKDKLKLQNMDAERGSELADDVDVVGDGEPSISLANCMC